jgi:hypothetical protein
MLISVYPSNTVPGGTWSELTGGVMNMGIVEGITAEVTVAEGPADCKLVEVRTASGSVLVIAAVEVETDGEMRKLVAVMN